MGFTAIRDMVDRVKPVGIGEIGLDYHYSADSAELQQKAFALIKEKNLILDLSNLSSMDSSGLSAILGSSTLGMEFGKMLYIMIPSSEARKALESTGFMDMFNIIFSVTEVV